MWTRKEFKEEPSAWAQDIILVLQVRDLTILPILPVSFAIPDETLRAVKGYHADVAKSP